MSIVVNTDPSPPGRRFHQQLVGATILAGMVLLIFDVADGGMTAMLREGIDPTKKGLPANAGMVLIGTSLIIVGSAFGMLMYLPGPRRRGP